MSTRPVRPGRLAVRRFHDGWAVFSSTPLYGWSRLYDGLYVNRFRADTVWAHDWPTAVEMAHNAAHFHRAALEAAVQEPTA